MPTLSAYEMQREPALVRRAVQYDGQVVALTFRGKPYGYVVPADQWRALANTDDNHETNEGESAA